MLGRTIPEELDELRRLTREQLTTGQILQAGVEWSDEVLLRTFGSAYVEQLRAVRGVGSRRDPAVAHVEVIHEARRALPPANDAGTAEEPEVIEAEIIEDPPHAITVAPEQHHAYASAASPPPDDMEEFLSTRDPVRLREQLRASQERALASLERDGRLSLADLGIIDSRTRRR